MNCIIYLTTAATKRWLNNFYFLDINNKNGMDIGNVNPINPNKITMMNSALTLFITPTASRFLISFAR
jgi:hypothetical protein